MCCAFTQFFCCAITQGEKEHPDINSRKAPPWRSGQEEPQTQARKRIIIAHPEHYRYRAPISAVMDTPSRAGSGFRRVGGGHCFGKRHPDNRSTQPITGKEGTGSGNIRETNGGRDDSVRAALRPFPHRPPVPSFPDFGGGKLRLPGRRVSKQRDASMVHYRYRAPISAVMDTPSRAEGPVARFSEVNALARSRKNAAL